MTTADSVINRLVSAQSCADALEILTNLERPLMLEVLQQVPGHLRGGLTAAAAARARRGGADVPRLTRVVWVLRELRLKDAGPSAEALAFLFSGWYRRR